MNVARSWTRCERLGAVLMVSSALACDACWAAPIVSLEIYRDENGVSWTRPSTTPRLIPATGDQSYDNWRSSSEGGETSLLTRFNNVGTQEIGDDLVLSNCSPSFVNDLGFTLVNGSRTQGISRYRSTFRFYDENLTLLGVVSEVVNTIFPPFGAASIFTSGGYFRPFNIPTAPRMFMTTQYTEVIGDNSLVGLLYGGPVTTGSSSRFIRNFTTGQQIDLGGEDQNLGFFIDTVPIPGPGALTVMAVAMGVVGCRRRR
jgi:hypothetical protein